MEPVVHAAASLGRWLAVNWDARRFLPPYAERLVEAVGTHAERHPGRGLGPAVPLPGPRAARA